MVCREKKTRSEWFPVIHCLDGSTFNFGFLLIGQSRYKELCEQQISINE